VTLTPPDIDSFLPQSGLPDLLRAMADAVEGKTFSVSPLWDLPTGRTVVANVARALRWDYPVESDALLGVYGQIEKLLQEVAQKP